MNQQPLLFVSPLATNSLKWSFYSSWVDHVRPNIRAQLQQRFAPAVLYCTAGIRSSQVSNQTRDAEKENPTTRLTTIPAPTEGLFSTSSFGALGLEVDIVKYLTEMNIHHPTIIQARGIPPILGEVDVVLGAATGSGKTLGYLLPIVQQLKQAETMRSENDPPIRVRRRPRAIILLPTRELAEQVMTVARGLSHTVKFRATCAVGGGGGDSSRRLRERLNTGPVDVLVTTTGRLLQLIDTREIDVRFAKHIVIDEADTMFDKGFGPEVRRILQTAGSALEKEPQLIAAGATHPPEATAAYAETFKRAKSIDADLHLTPVGLEQRFLRVAPKDKLAELTSLVQDDMRDARAIIVFCNTVESCRFVGHFLQECGVRVACAHGDMPPAVRDEEWAKFRRGDVVVLVATDMVGRGLDQATVDHVILFDFPPSAIDYVHRAGRTARAGAKGRVTSLVTRKDEQLARALEHAARTRFDAIESERDARREAEERKRREEAASREQEAKNAESATATKSSRNASYNQGKSGFSSSRSGKESSRKPYGGRSKWDRNTKGKVGAGGRHQSGRRR